MPYLARSHSGHAAAARAVVGSTARSRKPKTEDRKPKTDVSHQLSPDHIQSLLRCEPADAFAIPREVFLDDLRAVLSRDRMINTPHRLLRCAAHRSGDTGDADAERRLAAYTDSLCQGAGDL